MIIPFVTTDVRKPMSDPIPDLIDCLILERVTTNSAIIAPKKDQAEFRQMG